MNDAVIVRDDDPRCAELEADGYLIVGRSWGARLLLQEPPELSSLQRMVASVEASGVVIRELDASFANALFELESANNADYPFTPATFQPPPDMMTIENYWVSGKRIFGATVDDHLVGVVVGTVNNGVGDNEFASVLKEYRKTGIGAAISAASILAFSEDGIRTFTAGGAGQNDASLGLVRSVGFIVEEQWRSYQR